MYVFGIGKLGLLRGDPEKVALVVLPDALFLRRRVEYSCAHCEAGPGHSTTEILLRTVEEYYVSAQLRLLVGRCVVRRVNGSVSMRGGGWQVITGQPLPAFFCGLLRALVNPHKPPCERFIQTFVQWETEVTRCAGSMQGGRW